MALLYLPLSWLISAKYYTGMHKAEILIDLLGGLLFMLLNNVRYFTIVFKWIRATSRRVGQKSGIWHAGATIMKSVWWRPFVLAFLHHFGIAAHAHVKSYNEASNYFWWLFAAICRELEIIDLISPTLSWLAASPMRNLLLKPKAKVQDIIFYHNNYHHCSIRY